MELIYCGKGNKRLDNIAIDNGFKYGLRLPQTKRVETDLYFADQDWKSPNRKEYMKKVKEYMPRCATVLDLERNEQFAEVMDWAEEIATWVTVIIIIPKCDVIDLIPYEIRGRKVRLGFSVPTTYGATDLSPTLFSDRDVHLLGGSPEKQLSYIEKMNVVSMDCNYHSMKANRFGEYWTGKLKGETRWWVKYDGDLIDGKRSLSAFNVSCQNIIKRFKDI